jgi:hypothetical protein
VLWWLIYARRFTPPILMVDQLSRANPNHNPFDTTVKVEAKQEPTADLLMNGVTPRIKADTLVKFVQMQSKRSSK